MIETGSETKGELYRECVREFGRCTGKVYVDTKTGTKQRGWVFVKRMKYEDSKDVYLREVWVTVHESLPEAKFLDFEN